MAAVGNGCIKYTVCFWRIQKFFIILLKAMLYYKYTAGEVEKTDAVEDSADDPTVAS